jgi:hypothetical protein
MQAANFNPMKHLRRASALRESHIAERAKALGEALTSRQVANKLGITQVEVEQIAARHGFKFIDTDKQLEEA